jgi:hypothetical protein
MAVGSFRSLNPLKEFAFVDNMPAKWQILIRLGQEKIHLLQQNPA